MIIRNEDRVTSTGVRFNGKGEVTGTTVLPPEPSAFCGHGHLFNHVTIKPGNSLGDHRHEGEFEVYYFLKGEGIYNDNGTDVPVRAGDVAICKDGEVHGLKSTGTEDLEMIALILYS